MSQKSNIYNIGEKVRVNPDHIHLIDVRPTDKPSEYNIYVVTNIKKGNGTIFYNIEDAYDSYLLVEEALLPGEKGKYKHLFDEKNWKELGEPDDTTTEKEDVPSDHLGDDIPLTGNLNITLDGLDEDLLNKWHKQIDDYVEGEMKCLDDRVRKEFRKIVVEVLKENGLI